MNERLREELSELDVKLLEMVARRQQIVANIGQVKSASGRGTRDYAREKDVYLQLARRTAARVGLDEEVGPISSACSSVFHWPSGTGQGGNFRQRQRKRALVIGGAGQMGQWFVRFLASQGYQVEVCDPAGGLDEYVSYADLGSSRLDQDRSL